jgi:hypothetical protein
LVKEIAPGSLSNIIAQKNLLEMSDYSRYPEDDLRAYPLPTRGLKVCMGRPTLPEGIPWSNLPAPG